MRTGGPVMPAYYTTYSTSVSSVLPPHVGGVQLGTLKRLSQFYCIPKSCVAYFPGMNKGKGFFFFFMELKPKTFKDMLL